MFMSLRRSAPNEVHMFEIQWDKYGAPRFVINFGSCPSKGLEIRGELHPPERVSVGWLPQNGRLQPKPGTGTGSWFRQDKPFLCRLFTDQKLRPAPDVVHDLMQLFPELEAFWADGSMGPHLNMFPLR